MMKKFGLILPIILTTAILTSTPSAVFAAKPLKSKKAIEACVDKWVNAYRREAGEGTLIRADMLDEWEQWCKRGKQRKK